MEGVKYRIAETTDYPEIIILNRAEGWTTQVCDFENIKKLHPGGFIVAIHEDKLVG